MLLRSLWLLAALVYVLKGLKLSDITKDSALQDLTGNLSAFADFDSDKATDILVLNSTSTTQSLYLWNKGKSQFILFKLDISFLVAVHVGDFNGDGVLDLLCQQTPNDNGCSSVHIAWLEFSQKGTLGVVDTMPLFNTSSNSVLMAVDVNGDHISDIVATTCEHPHTLTVWTSRGTEKTFDKRVLKNGGRVGDIFSGHFLDLNSDCMPELVVFGQGDGSVGGQRRLDVWGRQGRELVWKQNISLHFPAAKLVSPPTFVDMNGDGVSEVVLVTCHQVNSRHNVCVDTLLHIFFQPEHTGSDVINCKGDVSWKLSFKNNISVNLTRGASLGVPLSVISAHPVLGDLELDSSPDMLVPVTNLTTNETFLLLLSGTRKGSFIPQWDNLMKLPSRNAVIVCFFDFWEDGVLDVLVQYMTPGGKGWTVSAHRQSLSADHTFLKVLVLSVHCYTECTASNLSYGSILPSASVTYSTKNRHGHTQLTTATSKSSSAPLQLPFILFGLGETPNFIEEFTVGMAVEVAENDDNMSISTVKVRFRKWGNLVPNSQVIVIPIPPIKPKSWHLELYLTPSHLIYTTVGVLCALAVGLVFLILLLHASEKYQDKQERKQAKHKFHFNAM